MSTNKIKFSEEFSGCLMFAHAEFAGLLVRRALLPFFFGISIYFASSLERITNIINQNGTHAVVVLRCDSFIAFLLCFLFPACLSFSVYFYAEFLRRLWLATPFCSCLFHHWYLVRRAFGCVNKWACVCVYVDACAVLSHPEKKILNKKYWITTTNNNDEYSPDVDSNWEWQTSTEHFDANISSFTTIKCGSLRGIE